MAQAKKPQRRVLYTGEKAEAVFRALCFAVHINKLVLRVNVPGLYDIICEEPWVKMAFYDSSGERRSVELLYDSKNNALIAETTLVWTREKDSALPVDELRALIERLLTVVYNYIAAHRAYLGKAEWANRGWIVMHIAAKYGGVDRLIASAFPELAVIDPDIVCNIVYVLPNGEIEVKIPPGVASTEELRKLQGEETWFALGTTMGSYVAVIFYSPFKYELIIDLWPPEEDEAKNGPIGIKVEVSIQKGTITFSLKSNDVSSPGFVKWAIENGCNIVMRAVEAIEEEAEKRALSKLLENIRLFKRIIEATCEQPKSLCFFSTLNS